MVNDTGALVSGVERDVRACEATSEWPPSPSTHRKASGSTAAAVRYTNSRYIARSLRHDVDLEQGRGLFVRG